MKEQTNIHALIIPSWYPSLNSEVNGIFFKEQVEAINKMGVKIGVVYTDVSGLREFKLSKLKYYNFKTKLKYEEGIPVYRFCSWNLYPSNQEKQFDYWVKHTLSLAELYINKFGMPDILHAHSAAPGGYVAYLLWKKYNIPYIVTEHSSSYALNLIREWEKKYINMAFTNAKEVIAVSSSFAKILKSYASGREFRVIPNSVDVEHFSLSHSREKKPFVFLTVAPLRAVKRIDILLEAFAQGFKGNKDVILRIGGSGEELERLVNLSKQLKIEAQVDFLGALNRVQVKEEMQKACVFVLPSKFETFGVVVIEALATGMPVISTICGGPEDIIISKVGEIVEPENIEAMKQALIKIHGEYDNYSGKEIRDYVVSKFSNEQVILQIVQLYR